jgi:hypothetical protein
VNDFGSTLWLGGAPCAGKSSIAELLGGRFEIDLLHVDETFDHYAGLLDQARHPALARWVSSSWSTRWAGSPEVLCDDVIACYREHLGFILDDVGSQPPTRRRTLVEGSAVLPAEIASVLTTRAQAIWLIPTPEFQARHYARREWVRDILGQCPEPTAAFARWMGRDAAFARWLREEVRCRGFAWVEVDDATSIEEVADLVARHFSLQQE